MVIGEMRAQEAPEMRLIENDHVIEILAPNGSDQALDVGTLPGTEWTRDDSVIPTLAILRRAVSS
jgi:hypothetical protein